MLAPTPLSDYWDKINLAMRIYITKRPRLLRFVRIASAVLFLGPWREILIKYYRRNARNEPLTLSPHSLFTDLNVEEVVANLESLGFSLGAVLAEDKVNHILEFCDQGGARRYGNPHLQCETIRNIVYDAKIVEIARNYIGAEPLLHRTYLYWTHAGHRGKNDPGAFSAKPNFHFDVGDFRSLVVFTYLTNVDEDSGPHVLIEGTHKHKTPSQLVSRQLSDEQANEKYGDKIRMITGPKGTMFFEELTCWHKHSPGSKSRLMLVISYGLQRKPPRVPKVKENAVCPTGSTTSPTTVSSSAK
jgi:hypothetical protein